MNPLDTVLARLPRYTASNGSFTAPCPAHDDHDPSLSISEGDDGRVLLKCFAGCAVGDVVAALDLEMKDLFDDPPGGRGGEGVRPPGNDEYRNSGAQKPHGNGDSGYSSGYSSAFNGDKHRNSDRPDLHVVGEASGTEADGCTFASYVEYVALPAKFLKGLGLSEITYQSAPAVRMPYLGPDGTEVCVRFRTALTGKPKIKAKSGDKLRLYGLDKLDEARKTGYVLVVEGESDTQAGWYHGEPVIGVPGASSFQLEWAAELDGVEKVYALIEPDEGGETLWGRLAASDLREKLYRVDLGDVADAKDLCDLHRLEAHGEVKQGGFKQSLHEALGRAVPWLDIAESEAQERFREAWAKCEDLAKTPDILERFYQALKASGVAGERRTAMILYLALTSRQLDKPVSVAVKGPSSGGKSYLVAMVLDFFPEAAYYALTAMSERALAYSEEPLKHRYLVLYEAEGMGGEMATYLIRSLLSEGCIRYETIEKTSEGMKPKMIEREGPTGLLITTTATNLHPENETRMVSLSVADSQDQTRAILQAIAGGTPEPIDLEPWRALQEWIGLTPRTVVIPYAKALADAIPPVAVRLRRDFTAVTNLIKAHAILHQATREHDDRGRIIATIEDYAAVRELVADLVSEGAGEAVSATVRKTVEAVKGAVLMSGGKAVTNAAVGKRLEVGQSTTWKRLKTALDLGYVKNLEEKRNQPNLYVVGEPMPDDITILPTADDLHSLFRYSKPTHGVNSEMNSENPDTYAAEEGHYSGIHDSPGDTHPPPPSDDDDPGPEPESDGDSLIL